MSIESTLDQVNTEDNLYHEGFFDGQEDAFNRVIKTIISTYGKLETNDGEIIFTEILRNISKLQNRTS